MKFFPKTVLLAFTMGITMAITGCGDTGGGSTGGGSTGGGSTGGGSTGGGSTGGGSTGGGSQPSPNGVTEEGTYSHKNESGSNNESDVIEIKANEIVFNKIRLANNVKTTYLTSAYQVISKNKKTDANGTITWNFELKLKNYIVIKKSLFPDSGLYNFLINSVISFGCNSFEINETVEKINFKDFCSNKNGYFDKTDKVKFTLNHIPEIKRWESYLSPRNSFTETEEIVKVNKQ